jgi:hypothetical protein
LIVKTTKNSFALKKDKVCMWVPLKLQVMIQKFPDFRIRIIQLYQHDENFKSLCEDYWLCTTLLEKQKNGMQADEELATEYDSICTTLEQDINEYLTK